MDVFPITTTKKNNLKNVKIVEALYRSACAAKPFFEAEEKDVCSQQHQRKRRDQKAKKIKIQKSPALAGSRGSLVTLRRKAVFLSAVAFTKTRLQSSKMLL